MAIVGQAMEIDSMENLLLKHFLLAMTSNRAP
jgi:hypothetical protein